MTAQTLREVRWETSKALCGHTGTVINTKTHPHMRLTYVSDPSAGVRVENAKDDTGPKVVPMAQVSHLQWEADAPKDAPKPVPKPEPIPVPKPEPAQVEIKDAVNPPTEELRAPAPKPIPEEPTPIQARPSTILSKRRGRPKKPHG